MSLPINNPDALRIGYLMQTGAPDMRTLSGAQLHVSATIKNLQNLGHQVRTIACQDGNIVWSDDLVNWQVPHSSLRQVRLLSTIERAIRRIQYELHLPYLAFFEGLWFADVCRHLLKGYDILYERHGWMGYGSVLAARWLDLPLIEELNGNIVKQIEVHGFQLSPAQWKVSRWLTHRTFSAANHLVVVSEALKDQLVTGVGIPADRISVVLNGADIELFTRSYDESQVRARYDVWSPATVAFVGNFQPWHGLELLVSSFQDVQAQFPEAQLLIIGDGAAKEKIVRQIERLGLGAHVRLLGRLPQPEVAAVLSISDIAAIPYPYENTEIVGTPLKLIEYMAAGKAIVASTAPIHEIIVDGRTGLRVPPADDQALSKAMIRLLANDQLRAELGANARRAAQGHSWDEVARELSQILGEILIRSNPRGPGTLRKSFGVPSGSVESGSGRVRP